MAGSADFTPWWSGQAARLTRGLPTAGPARKTSPVDATWLVPHRGFAAGPLATDSDVSRHLSDAPGTLRRYRRFSDYGVYWMAGSGVAIYPWGLS